MSRLSSYSPTGGTVVSSGSSGSSIIDGEVATFADLPVASNNNGSIYKVAGSTGTWVLGTKKNAGFYESDGSSWNFLGAVVDKVTEAQKTAGTFNSVTRFTPKDIKDMIDTHGGSGGGGAVDSVNTQTGAVVLDADDISDTSTTNKFATSAELTKLAGIATGAEVNAVDSVNTQTGAVVLDADDIDDSATLHKFATAAQLSKIDGVEAGAEVNTVDSVNSQTGAVSLDADDIDDTSTTNKFATSAQLTKLNGIETGAEANNISDANATDLTDGGASTLHYHASDRDRANHTGTQTASTISDFDTEVANNSAVVANTAKVGVTDEVSSTTAGITGADQITNMVSLTQAEYDAITPNASTFYLITDA